MIENLEFDIQWLATESGTDAERASFGALELKAGDVILTDVIDLIAKTPRTSVRLCLDTLAHWLIENWWRLRWEPGPPGAPSLGWRMAHEMAAAGGGFVWPQLQFASDGETVTIHQEPTSENHTLRFITGHELICSASGFERGIDDFVSAVAARQVSLSATDQTLQQAWGAVREERNDPEASEFRKHEALLGLNPGELDADALADLFRQGSWIGKGALDEALATVSADNARDYLSELEQLRQQPLQAVSFRRVMDAGATWNGPITNLEPWQNGTALAQHLRQHWNLGNEPFPDEFMNDLVDADIHTDISTTKSKPVLAFRDDDRVRPLLKETGHKTSRRFAMARLFADAAVAHTSDALLPLTPAKTARQKLQRAAAQELLCPIAGLTERLTLPCPDEEEIAEAADYFQVSELVVRSALVNKKLVGRMYLD